MRVVYIVCPERTHKTTQAYDMIYLLTAIQLSPGGSSTVHIYTETVHRMLFERLSPETDVLNP